MAAITHPDSSRRRMAAIGTWDGVHLGHRHIIASLTGAAREASLAPAAVTFSSHPLATVRPDDVPPLLCTLDERIDRLHDCGVDDCILLDFNEELRALTAREFMEMLHRDYAVDAVMLGFNNSFGSDRLSSAGQYRQAAEGTGVSVALASEYRHSSTPSVSSSAIRRLVAAGSVDEAARLLGQPLKLSGIVASGKQIGRTIGFPTANITPPAGMAVPAEGVYACTACIDGDSTLWPAMVNIGRRPTVTTGQAGVSPVIEAHLIGFSGDIYGRRLTLSFVRRLRGEIRYPSLEALTARLVADRAATLAALAPR